MSPRLAPRTLATAVVTCLARCRTRLVATGSDGGMTTAEYAVGTVAACGFGGILYKIVTSAEIIGLLRQVIASALKLNF